MSAWSLKFKNRMMQLETAVRDPETGKVYLITKNTESQWRGKPIHRDLYENMNEDRIANGLKILVIPNDGSFDDWEGRGFEHKLTKEFMRADVAGDWASATGYNNDYWSGESLSLRRKQDTIAEGI